MWNESMLKLEGLVEAGGGSLAFSSAHTDGVVRLRLAHATLLSPQLRCGVPNAVEVVLNGPV